MFLLFVLLYPNVLLLLTNESLNPNVVLLLTFILL